MKNFKELALVSSVALSAFLGGVQASTVEIEGQMVAIDTSELTARLLSVDSLSSDVLDRFGRTNPITALQFNGELRVNEGQLQGQYTATYTIPARYTTRYFVQGAPIRDHSYWSDSHGKYEGGPMYTGYKIIGYEQREISEHEASQRRWGVTRRRELSSSAREATRSIWLDILLDTDSLDGDKQHRMVLASGTDMRVMHRVIALD